MEKLPH